MAEATSAYPAVCQFVGGNWEAPGARETSPITNPATGIEIGRLPHATSDDLDRALDQAASTFRAWRRTAPFDRALILKKAAQLLRERAQAVATIMTLEQGKTIAESRIEVLAAADVFDWFAEEARRAYGRIVPSRSPDIRYSVLREPVGPVAAFSPWNFPAVIPARKIAAALGSGCTCIIKPAEETPATCLELARALQDAGLPPGVLSVVTGNPAFISSYLLQSPVIRKLSFTGSTAVGKQLGALAGAHVKRATLELGGHAPVIVCDDADIGLAVAASVAAKYRNAGQVCISPTRFYVHSKVYDSFVEAFAAQAAALKVGDGLAPDTQMGPMANSRRVQAMQGLVADAVEHGARLVTGGNRISGPGFFWKPTVLADVPISARVMNDEPFGPIAVASRFDRLEDALEMANRLPFGLAAYAFSTSVANCRALTDGIECGMLGINNFAINFAETPFGGVKESGFGSEGGTEGMDGYLVTKLVSQS